MNNKRVAAVSFYFLNQGQGYDHIVEYIMIDKNGEYTRREYNITIKEWSYQLQWYQTTAKSEFEYIDIGFLCE